MWPIAKQLYDEAPLFQALVLAAAVVTAVALFSSVFTSAGSAQASTVMPIPTGPGAYLSPYPTPAAMPALPPQIMPSLQARQPVMSVEQTPTVGRPLIDTSAITEIPKPRQPQHAVAPGAVGPRTSSQPRPLVGP